MKIFALTLLSLFVASTAFAAEFTLSSPQVKDGGTLTIDQVYNGFGCTGNNISPALEWKNAPAGTKSFAITVYDPDAPTGSGWWHWVAFNIPADVNMLEAGATNKMPAGVVQSLTDFGTPGFGGACPPEGDKAHRYIFTIHALSVPTLGPDATAMPAFVGFNLSGTTLAKASFTALYSR